MDFTGIVWWAYIVTGIAGIGFGILQSLVMKHAVLGAQPRQWLYVVKLALWAVALGVMALISVALLLVFAVVASITLVIGSALIYHRAQKEAR